MQFTEVTEEELGQLQFASGGRSRNGKNPYGDLLEAIKGGKKVKVLLEEGKALKNLKWGLSQAAKKEGMKIDMRVLADSSGVVVSYAGTVQAPSAESDETKTETPTTGSRSRT